VRTPSIHFRCWLLSIAVALSVCRPAHGEDRQQSVLVLHSTGRESQISQTSERELRRSLDRGLARPLDYYSEYLDAGRFPDAQHREAFRNFLRLKYSGHRFSLVIAMQDVAIEFVSRNRNDLFSGTPVVFFTVNPIEVSISKATGVVASLDLCGTLELALQLQPDVKEVFVVSGAAARDKAIEAQARAQFVEFAPHVAFTYLSGLPTPQLEQRLAHLPDKSIIYYLLVYEDGSGHLFQPLDYLDRLAATTNRPIYSWIDSTIGRGVVGGDMQRVDAQVGAVAAVALRVLNGEDPDTIPVSVLNLHVAQVDWRQLRRWRINEARLPPGTVTLFREPGPWERYQGYILGAAGLMLAQTALIAALLVQSAKRRRAEARVRASQTALCASLHRLRDLGGRLIGAQEAERSRVARELHDDVGQQAALLEIDLELLGEDAARSSADLRKDIEKALDRTRTIARTVRDLSHRLHPPALRLIGPAAALASLQREFGNANVVVTLDHQNVPSELPQDLTLCVFRIVQEALRNAVTHGAARAVSVTLAGGEVGLTLLITDDGVGFDVNSLSGSGLGLTSMRERLEPLGGTLKIHSRPGGGTRLEVTVPYQPGAER
jgi:signal transduction histidine kinase